MNSKAAKYGIYPVTTDGGGRSWEISPDNFKRMISDYAAKEHAREDLALSTSVLRKWEKQHQIGWPKDHTPTDRRKIHYDNYLEDGVMLWERKLAAQGVIKRDFAKYTGKVTVMSCTHFPFAAYDRMETMLDRENGKLGKLIIAGDVNDLYNLSLFRKQYNINPLTEVRAAINGVKQLKGYSDSILLMTANHDDRLGKRVAERLNSEMQELQEKLVGELSTIKYIADEAKVDGTQYWFIQLNNLFIAHPENTLSSPLKTAERVTDFATVRWDGIDIIFAGHTHAVGMRIYRKMLIAEIGCMSRQMDYTLAGKLGPLSRELMYNCYMTVNFVKGQAVMDSVRLNYLGPAK